MTAVLDLEATRIDRGNYFADVLRGSGGNPFWYYLVQRKGSSAVLDLARFETREQAVESAQKNLRRLNQAKEAAS